MNSSLHWQAQVNDTPLTQASPCAMFRPMGRNITLSTTGHEDNNVLNNNKIWAISSFGFWNQENMEHRHGSPIETRNVSEQSAFAGINCWRDPVTVPLTNLCWSRVISNRYGQIHPQVCLAPMFVLFPLYHTVFSSSQLFW